MPRFVLQCIMGDVGYISPVPYTDVKGVHITAAHLGPGHGRRNPHNISPLHNTHNGVKNGVSGHMRSRETKAADVWMRWCAYVPGEGPFFLLRTLSLFFVWDCDTKLRRQLGDVSLRVNRKPAHLRYSPMHITERLASTRL